MTDAPKSASDSPDDPSLVQLSGSLFDYDYRWLRRMSSSENLAAYTQRTRALFVPTAKAFDDHRNTEWLLRSYLALKLILHATIMVTSADYSRDRNVRVAVPYLIYYALFSACRAFLLTCPDVTWEGAATARFGHRAAIDLATDLLKRLDPRLAAEAALKLNAAKDQRELFSYAFPMSGPRVEAAELISLEEATAWAGVLSELAHLNTACLEGAVAKHRKGMTFGQIDDEAWELMSHPLHGGAEYFDNEDWAWLAKLFRIHKRPVALTALATEGMTEDFFGYWTDSDDAAGAYDPDDDWRVLLHVW